MVRNIVRSANSLAFSLIRLPKLQSQGASLPILFISSLQTARAHSTYAVPPVATSPPTTQPPSARPVTTRKSQLIRSYTALLRTSPLLLFFQHSNLTAVEWAAVRRELKRALSAVPPTNNSQFDTVAGNVRLEVLKTNMFNVAMKIVEFHGANDAPSTSLRASPANSTFLHDLSKAAYESIQLSKDLTNTEYSKIAPLMVGPLAALVLPTVSPVHLAAALSVLAPVPGLFPPPTRKKNPGYHEPTCQNGLAKLLLVGGRIERKTFDQAGVNWVGGIEGGIGGLHAQLVHLLQSPSLGLSRALDSGSQNIWLALEGRKEQLKI